MANINELDINKLNACVENETNRLKIVVNNINKKIAEIERYERITNQNLERLNTELINLEKSYQSGTDFLNRCNERINQLNSENN